MYVKYNIYHTCHFNKRMKSESIIIIYKCQKEVHLKCTHVMYGVYIKVVFVSPHSFSSEKAIFVSKSHFRYLVVPKTYVSLQKKMSFMRHI